MAKLWTNPTLLDGVKRVTISKLKEWGYLSGRISGLITWSRDNVVKSSISIDAYAFIENPYIELSYSYDKTEDIKYRVPLVSVPSNLGKGVVWYFVCPFVRKRCRVLYFSGKYFVHREAIRDGMYECQTHSKNARQIIKVIGSSNLATEMYELLHKKHAKLFYRGKPTKRLQQIMKIDSRLEKINRIDWRKLF